VISISGLRVAGSDQIFTSNVVTLLPVVGYAGGNLMFCVDSTAGRASWDGTAATLTLTLCPGISVRTLPVTGFKFAIKNPRKPPRIVSWSPPSRVPRQGAPGS